MGAGHTVTALYEIAPAGTEIRVPGVDPLKYQEPKGLTSAANTGDAFTLKVRYKEPKEEISRLVSLTVRDERKSFDGAPANFRFATAVAAFGMLLRESPHLGTANYAQVREWARRASQRAAEREEFIQLVQKAEVLGPAKRRIAGRDAN